MIGKVTILGPGMLGGSIGLAIKRRKAATRVVVWARRIEAGDAALQRGAADEATHDLRRAVVDSDLVVLATPIGVMRSLAEQIRTLIPPVCVVTDVGSVKYPVVSALGNLLPKFVGSHPMAGSEQAGIEAARADLLEKAICIVTPQEDTDPTALGFVHEFWKSLGCSVWSLSPTVHDEIVAHISHLPHMVAAGLVNVVCRDGAERLKYVGPGFKDVTRIASGPPDMWAEICLENRQEIGRAMDQLMEELEKVRAALENSDAIELRAMLKRAKHFRDELRFRT